MKVNFLNGTPQQQNLVEVAIGLCSYPLDELTNVTVDVVWGDTFAPSDSFHPYMTTTPVLDGFGVPTGTFIVEIASWADDPNAPGNQGLLDPATQIRGFYLESFVHEIGHIVSQVSFMSWVYGAIPGLSATYGGKISNMCALFTTGSGDSKRQGTAADFDNLLGPNKTWDALIKEAVAEWFHWGFYTGSPFIFTNRTIWTISEEKWPQFNALLEAGDLVTGLRWQVTGWKDGAGVVGFTPKYAPNVPNINFSGEFDLDRPWQIGGGIVGRSVGVGAHVQALLETVNPAPSQQAEWFMLASVVLDEVSPIPPYLDFTPAGDILNEEGVWGPIGGDPPPPFFVSQNFSEDLSGSGGAGYGALEPSDINSGVVIQLAGTFADSGFSFLISFTSTWTLLATGDSLSFSYATGMNDPIEFDLVRSFFISGDIGGGSFTNGGSISHDHSVTEQSDAIAMGLSLITTTIPVTSEYPHVIPIIIGTAVPGPAATGLQLVEGD